MSRTLAIATTAGLLLCALFLGLAIMIGGDDIFHDARSLKEVKPLIDLATHKTWHWSGGDTLALDAPLNIRYRPSEPPGVLVTGPEEMLKHVRVSDGRIASDTNTFRRSGKRLDAVVSGVSIRKFVVNGGESLDLGQIDQPGLDLHINGNGTVSGGGKVARLNLVIAGSGKAELGGLSVGDARISLLGSGSAILSPHGDVQLFIAGSGRLGLLTRPTHLRQTILGSGEVNQLVGEAAKAALKSVGVSRIASEAANNAIQATLGNGNIGRIAGEAARKGVESAQIEQQVQRGVAEGLSRSTVTIDSKTSSVAVHDHNDVDLGHIERDSLNVTIASSGSATAEGKVDRLNVNIMGSGHARLGKLAARDVSVMIMGSGSATIAPSGDLKVTIMGSGDVHLLTRPAKIHRNIMGSGRVIEEH
jgi:hypothetical protein